MPTPNREFTAEDLAQHAEWLRRLARALTRVEAEAEDIAQATWERVLDTRSSSVMGLRPLLAKVAHGLARDRRRSNSRRQQRERAAASQGAWPSAADIASRIELTEHLAQALGALDESQRAVIVLRYFDGFSSAEIAQRLGVPAATVRSRLKRGLDELRARLGADRDGGAGSTWGILVQWGREETTATALAGGVGLVASTTKVAFGAVTTLALAWWLWHASGETPIDPPELGSHEPAIVELVPPLIERHEPTEDRGPVSAAERLPLLPATLPFRARLVDAISGLHVPHYGIRLKSEDGTQEEAESDGQGRIETSTSWPAGTLGVEAYDHDSVRQDRKAPQVSEHAHDPTRATDPVVIPVRVGPTYAFSTTLPEGSRVGDFWVELQPTVLDTIKDSRVTRLRAGSNPWVRYGPSAPHLRGGGPWELRVLSEDGFWFGRATVGGVRGVYPELIPLTLEARGVLVIRLTHAAPHGPRDTATNRLVVRGPEGEERSTRATRPLYHMLPGEYEVEYSDARHHPARGRALVAAGQTTEFELALQPLPDLLPIAGVLRVTEGQFDFNTVTLEIRSHSDDARQLHRIHQSGPRAEVPFRFEQVPAGKYTLKLLSRLDLRAVPEEITVHAGDEGLVLRCEVLDVRAVTYRLEILDANTGEPVPRPSASCRDEAGWRLTFTDTSGQLEVDGHAGASEQWMIRAEGYAPWWGTDADLGPEATNVIYLAPGWGADLYVKGPEGEPLAGIVILFDGESVGASDKEGHLRVKRAGRPERIEIDSDGWEITTKGRVKPDGSYSDNQEGITLRLAPRK